MNFTDSSELLTPQAFEEIKNFVLRRGDRRTYRNFDSHNPHYRFKHFDVFFGSDIGQQNITNDPALSDFNQLTIYDSSAEIQYYELILVRKADVSKQRSWLRAGMEEERVYLVDVYDKGLKKMQKTLMNYLEQLRNELTSSTS